MFLKEFPDYAWLKKQADSAFQGKLMVQGKQLPKEGWPLVILNTQTRLCDRQNIKGPFSIFTNIRGTSTVRVCKQRVQVHENSFYITNRAQHYSLEVDSQTDVETFNIHLGQDVWEDFVHSQSHSHHGLLDNPFGLGVTSASEFPNMLQFQSPRMSHALKGLHLLSKVEDSTNLQLEEALLPLFQALVLQKQELVKQLQQLTLVKAATREELYRRIAVATDYILSCPEASVTLEQLSGLACLSKFHFLRTFTSIHRLTPHQFILQQKLKKGQRLLSRTRLPVGDIALLCGFTEISAFSRAFRKYLGCTPQVYRLQSN